MIPGFWDQVPHWASCSAGSLLLPLCPIPPTPAPVLHVPSLPLSLCLSLSQKQINNFKIKILFFRFLIFFRERVRAGWGVAERERGDPKQSPRPAWSPVWDSISHPEIMTWAEIKSWTFNQLSHVGAPKDSFFFKKTYLFILKREWERVHVEKGRGRGESQAASLLSMEPNVGLDPILFYF